MRGKRDRKIRKYQTSDLSLKRSRRVLRLDYILFGAALITASLGVLMVYSATRSSMPGGVSDPQYYLKKQALFLGIGLAVFIALQFLNYHKIKSFWWAGLGIGILLLAAVLVFGYEVNNSKSWIDLGIFPMQPSEFSKIFMIIALAGVLSKWKKEKIARVSFVKVLLSIAVAFSFILLVILEPDFGTAIVYLAIYIGMLFTAGANFLYILGILGITAGGVFGAYNLGLIKQYQMDRILVFLRPEVSTEGVGYNLYQSKIAIGSGGLLGKGLFLGKQTNLSYVPEHHTDFIFSVIGEEIGFIGAFVVIAMLGVIIWRCFNGAYHSGNSFGMLICSGVGFMILTQMAINIGMTIGIMPIIGIPLPFLSSGGSSLISTFFGIALVEIFLKTSRLFDI
jgi:rod shape determining protein RodA